MLRTYTVKRGDTIDAVGRKFKVSPSTIYWANDLKNTRLVKGWKLTIPPVTGLVVTVKATDTLASLAKAHKIKPDAILAANKLEDPNLVMGQVLVMPGARGPKMVQAPKPKKVAPKGTTSKSGAVAGGGPARYTGGRFVWPVAGGGDVSRGFAGGHQGLDVAADTGTGVKAAAGGKVIFAGWKSNGGGYQVWISHGSGLYTTYNHMSSISVGTGQSVGRGQRIGGVGSTGNSSGPHLHFEVWKGSIWNGGSRVNPMGYL
jgi:murein DD-endopeptidase MepM/ murein hydrolase activator NlpD